MKKAKTIRQFERLCRREGRSTPYLPANIVSGPEPKRWAPVLSAACASFVVIALTAAVVLYGTPLGQNWLRPAGPGATSSGTRPAADLPQGSAATTSVPPAAPTTDGAQGTLVTRTTRTTKPAEAATPTSAATATPHPPAALPNPQSLAGYKQAIDLLLGQKEFLMQDTLTRKWILVPSDESFAGLNEADRTEMLRYMREKGLDMREMTMEELIAQGYVTEHTLVNSDDGSVTPYKTYRGAAGLRFSIERDGDGYVLHLTAYYGPLGAEGIYTDYERADGGWRLKAPEHKVMA